MRDKIQTAYHDSINVYDNVLTQRSLFGKLYIKLFWSGTDDNAIASKVLSFISDDMQGKLLDVPVGTAVFTHRKWAQMKKAQITCLDYSSDMIEQAKERMKGLQNVSCIQGDVGNLPFEGGTFNVVLSMNGFHAFPDKERAFSEIERVLKPGGFFIACFYIKGESKITDWLVKNILSKKGWFTPPFHTQQEIHDILRKRYKQVELHTDGSMVYFSCVK